MFSLFNDIKITQEQPLDLGNNDAKMLLCLK